MKNIDKYEYNLYAKSEPGGEISCGRLSDEQVAEIRKQHGSDDFHESQMIEQAFEYDNMVHVYGIFSADIKIGLPNGKTKSIIRVNENKENSKDIHFDKKENGEFQDGFYMIFTNLGKLSVDISFAIPASEPFDSKKLTIKCTNIDLSPVKSVLYDEIKWSVWDAFYYDGLELDDPDPMDRGLYSETYIVQFYDNSWSMIYYLGNDGKSKWGELLN